MFFNFGALNSSELSSARQIFSLKSTWMNSKLLPLDLKGNCWLPWPLRMWIEWSNGVISTTWHFPIYREEGYDSGKGVVLVMVNRLRYLLPEGRPRLFFIISNSKLCCLNLEADRVTFVLQIGDFLEGEINHIVQSSGDLFPESPLALSHLNC